MTSAIHSIMPLSPGTQVSPNRISQQNQSEKVKYDAINNDTNNSPKKHPPGVAVKLSRQALSRSADLDVRKLNEQESKLERNGVVFDAEAEIILRTPKIMSYKNDATVIYTKDLLHTQSFTFYV